MREMNGFYNTETGFGNIQKPLSASERKIIDE